MRPFRLSGSRFLTKGLASNLVTQARCHGRHVQKIRFIRRNGCGVSYKGLKVLMALWELGSQEFMSSPKVTRAGALRILTRLGTKYHSPCAQPDILDRTANTSWCNAAISSRNSSMDRAPANSPALSASRPMKKLANAAVI